jgi:hypothetical protein
MAKKIIYGPNQRRYFDTQPEKIRSFSKVNYVNHPAPIANPIVSNDIAWMESDYTYIDEEDIWDEDYWDDNF